MGGVVGIGMGDGATRKAMNDGQIPIQLYREQWIITAAGVVGSVCGCGCRMMRRQFVDAGRTGWSRYAERPGTTRWAA